MCFKCDQGALCTGSRRSTYPPRLRLDTHRTSRFKNDGTDTEIACLAEMFVNLVDVLPPLPEKGKFDVKAIKQSQYFFS